MRRFIITGTPGAGKTAILRELELEGFSVVEEAATDVIAVMQARGVMEPWKDPGFIDSVLGLQQRRRARAASQPDELQFHDRSPVCTAALAAYLGFPLSARLKRELVCLKAEAIYEPRVFFIQNLGTIMPTEARRITFEEALRFEKIHEDTYRELGFDLVPIHPGTLSERVAAIREFLSREFPRFIYHATKPSVMVCSAREERALGPEWSRKYIPRPYPTVKHHWSGKTAAVKNADEDAALGAGWADRVTEFDAYKDARRIRRQRRDPGRWLMDSATNFPAASLTATEMLA